MLEWHRSVGTASDSTAYLATQKVLAGTVCVDVSDTQRCSEGTDN